MKQIILCLIGLVLTQQGCALIPSQFHLSKKEAGSHKQKEIREHKVSKQQHKEDKTHPSLKERITLVDFKFFDKDQHKSKKHHKKTLIPPATGKVSTAFFAFGIDLVDIPWQGTTLMSFLVEHELDSAVATTQTIFREEAIDNQKADAAKAVKVAQEIAEKNKSIISILDLRPDVIVLQQGSIATVMPRAMLAYPQIANIPVVPDDAINTLDIAKQDLNLSGNLFSNEEERDKKTGKVIRKQYRLTGFTKQSGSFFTDIDENNPDINLKSDDILRRTKAYSQEFNENAPAVTVVYRNYRGRLYRILIPNQYNGALRRPEFEKADLSADEKKAINTAGKKWDQNYKNFNILIIQDGDVIEFTTLDLLDLTSPVHALPAVR